MTGFDAQTLAGVVSRLRGWASVKSRFCPERAAGRSLCVPPRHLRHSDQLDEQELCDLHQ